MIYDHFFHRNLKMQPRRFEGMRLLDAGYFPQKKEQLDRAVPTFNYSIILSGRGTYRSNEQQFAVEAPCVITQLPSIHTTYGPRSGTCWEELYFILPPDKLNWAKTKGLTGINPNRWSIQNPAAVIQAIRPLLSMLQTTDQQPGTSDRIDFLAERIIMETLLPGAEIPSPASEAVTALARAMETHPEQTYNIQQTATDFGVSFSTFRRRWSEMFDVPPGQYQQNLRIAESCRLLVQTDLKLVAIGQRVGFEDPAYFSRIFKQCIGTAPTNYRHAYQAAPSTLQHPTSAKITT